MMLTNSQIKDRLSNGKIRIEPFDPRQLGIAHYRLTVSDIEIVKLDDDDGTMLQTKLGLSSKPYALAPKEYVVVTLREKIILSERIFGQFYPASISIEQGLMLNCGRLNPGYDKEIRFGLFNAGDTEFVLRKDQEIARIAFVEIPDGTPIDPVEVTGDAYAEVISVIREKEARLREIRQEEEKIKDELRQYFGNKR